MTTKSKVILAVSASLIVGFGFWFFVIRQPDGLTDADRERLREINLIING